MNSLHTSAQQRSPIRGVALRPLSGRAGDSTSANAASPSLEALDAMQKDVSLLHRTLRSVLKATRTAAKGSAVQVMVFVLALFAMTNIASAQNTRIWRGTFSGDWGNPANWSDGVMTGVSPPGSGTAGNLDVAIFDAASGSPTISTNLPAYLGSIVVQGNSSVTLSPSTASATTFGNITVNAASTLALKGVGVNITYDATITGTATIFGTLKISDNTRFFSTPGNVVVNSDGTLDMNGGNFALGSNMPTYSATGNRGRLLVSGPTSGFVEVTAANVIIPLPNPMPGNVTINRGANLQTTIASMVAVVIDGRLDVQQGRLILPNQTVFVGSVNTSFPAPEGILQAGGTSTALRFTGANTVSNVAFLELPQQNINALFMENTANSSTVNLNTNLNVIVNAITQFGLTQTSQILNIATGKTLNVAQDPGMMAALTGFGTNVGTINIASGSVLNVSTATGVAPPGPPGTISLTNSGIINVNDGTLRMTSTATVSTNSPNYTTNSRLEYVDVVGAMAGPSTVATVSAEWPHLMNGQILINKSLSQVAGVFALGSVVLPANTHKILNNRLTISQGNLVFGSQTVFTVNNELLIANPVTSTIDVGTAGNSTFIFNGTVNSTLSLTTASIQQLNALEHRSASRLTLRNNDLVMQGTVGLYYPGQVRLFGTGTMALAARKITFNGTATEGGMIVATTGTGSLAGDAAATLVFQAPRPSFVQMSQSGSENNLGGMVLNATDAPAPMSPLVTVMNPVIIQTVTLGTAVNQGGIIRISNGATLTADNPIQTFTGAFGSAVPVAGVASNFIDAPGTPSGGTYIQRNVAIPGTRVFPIGVDRQSPVGTYAPSYTPITVNIPSASMGTDTYTVSATTAITNLVATIPNRVNVQWSINKATPMPAAGTVSFRWASNTYPLGDNLTASLTTDVNSITVPTTASVRRWNGASYLKESTSRILAPFAPVAAPADGTIDIPAGGTLSITNPYVISNDPFPIFWVGRGVTTTWADANNWSATSGGLGGAAGGGSVPGASDFVTFDQNALVPSPIISTGFPIGVQRLAILGNAQPTFAQPNAIFSLRQSSTAVPGPQLESLFIERDAGLTLQSMTMNINPQPMAGNFEGATVFGRLSLLQNSTFAHVVANQATQFITIANGARLVVDRSTATTTAAGLVKGSAVALNYQTAAPYGTAGPPNGLNGTLIYEDSGTNPVVLGNFFNTQNELGATLNGAASGPAVFPGNIIINRTGTDRRVIMPFMPFTVSSSVTVSAGEITLATANTLTVGSSLGVGETGSRTLTVLAPNGNIAADGNIATQLRIAGPGASVLRFASDPVVQRSLGILRIDEPGAAVTLNSGRNLIMTGAPGLDLLRASNTLGLHVSPNDTITIGNAANGQINAVNGGRMIVSGRMVVSPQGTFANNRLSGLVIGTSATLEIQDSNVGPVSGTVTVQPVTYLAPTSLLTYTGNRPTSTRTTAEFPLNFGGSLLLNKAPSTQLALGGFGNSTIITGASVRLREGFLTLQGNTLAVSGATLTMEAGRLVGDGSAAGTSALVYNSPTPGQLFMEPSQSFLAKLEINGAGSLTLSTNSNLTIGTNTGPLSNPPGPYSQQPTGANNNIGQLRLDVGTGGLVMNGSSVIFANVGANSGQLITSSTSGGAIIGDNNSTLRFESPRASTLRMAGGTSGTLRDILVNSGASITPGVPLVTLLNNLTVRRTTFANALAPAAGGGTLLLANTAVELKITDPLLGLTGAPPPTNDNNYVDVSGGGRLTMTVPMSSTASFIIGLQNFTGLANRYAPVRITNTGAQEDYTVSATSAIVNLPLAYPDRVNVQWNISKSTAAPVSNTVRFDWDQLHENTSFFVAPTFVRNIATVQQWNGVSTYNEFGSTPAGAAPLFNNTSTIAITSFATNRPFIVSGPAPATLLAPTTSNSISAVEGFQSGNLTVTSGTPFSVALSVFNGLGQRAQVLTPTNVAIQAIPLSGSPAIFTTSGTSVVTLTPGVNPTSATTASMVFDWINPGNLTTTQATLRLYSTALNSVTTVTLTILAPPLRGSTIAMTQVQNSSTGTQGFNGGGLGQFNITGGGQIPIDFGFFSQSNFLVGTTSITTVTASIAPHPSNPAATFLTTPGMGINAINPAIVQMGATGGFIMPVFNVNNVPVNPGIVRALLTLSAPGLGSTTVTIVIATTGSTTPFVATRLGYSVNSLDIVDPVLAVSGFNGGNFGIATPIVSNSIVPVNFASFANEGAVVRPNVTTQVQMSIAADPMNPGEVFTLEGTTATTISGNGTASLFPRIIFNSNSPATRVALVTLTAVSGQTTLISTTAQVWVTTTGTLATLTSFNPSLGQAAGHLSNAIGGAGINGGNLNIPSGRPFNIDFGYFNASNVPALGGANPMQLSIVSVTPFGQNVTIDGTSSLNVIPIVRQARMSNVILNWRNPSVAGPITVRVRLTPVNLLSGFVSLSTTEADITLSTGASVPVALAFSQFSSTGTQGINGGNLTTVSGAPINIDLGLFDANGVLSASLSNSSVTLTVQPITGGQNFTATGNTGGVFVNQSGIRLNNVAITWTNPTALTTQVRLVVSTIAGAGPIAATSAVITVSAASFFPAITGFSPGAGGPGSTIFINGINFTGVNSVSFGGAPATTFTVLGDNLISVVVPPGAVTGTVTVSRPPGPNFPGGSGTSTINFIVGTPPTITSFSPTAGGIGTQVRITGTNLLGITQVVIADVLASVSAEPGTFSPDGTLVTAVLTGPLTVTVGTLAVSRTGPVRITSTNGVGVSAGLFTYNPPPLISSVTPNSAIVNGQDIPIVIRGTNFDITTVPIDTASTFGVYFSINNAPLAISPELRISVQSASATEIRATISGTFNNSVSQRFVTVRNKDGQLSSIPFQLLAGGVPTLTSITPSSTIATGVAFIATINGTNFFGPAGTTVTANGNIALTVLSANSTQVRVIIPASLNLAGGTIRLVVRNSDGQTVQGNITVSDPGRAEIQSLSPSRAVVGSPTFPMTITGRGFFLNATVTFNNTPLQILNNPAPSTTQIVVLIPSSLLTTFGTAPIRVINPGGSTGTALFSVGYPQPIITSVLTASGAVSGQTSTSASSFPFQLAINGTGFRGDMRVTFGSSNVTIVGTSATQVIVQIPGSLNMTPGGFPITLSNSDGLTASTTFTITASNAPVITALSPITTNATATPFNMTITGQNFAGTLQGQPLPGLQVRYRGTALQILSATPTQIVVFVPAGVNNAEGTQFVQVINPDTQFGERPINVLCAVCPIITGITPETVRQQYPFDVTFTVSGSNFQQGATVSVGGIPLRVIRVDANQIIAVAPAGFFFGDPTLRVLNPDGRSFTANFRTGIREVAVVETMTGNVYPNPIEDMVSFEATLPKAGQLRVRITDILGNTVVLFTQAVSAGKFSQQLDVSALQTGVYIFEMTDGERRFTDKLIKR